MKLTSDIRNTTRIDIERYGNLLDSFVNYGKERDVIDHKKDSLFLTGHLTEICDSIVFKMYIL